MNNITLKPCPFCGGAAEISTYDFGSDIMCVVTVRCVKCNAIKQDFANYSEPYSGQERLAELWNTRVTAE